MVSILKFFSRALSFVAVLFFVVFSFMNTDRVSVQFPGFEPMNMKLAVAASLFFILGFSCATVLVGYYWLKVYMDFRREKRRTIELSAQIPRPVESEKLLL